MHGSMSNSPFEIEYFNRLARGHVEAGDLRTPYNSAMFWAFDDDHGTALDRNLPVLKRFRLDRKALGETFLSLRDLPKYHEFVPGIHMPESCAMYSAGYAHGATGDTVTVAVNQARPGDYFRLAEVAVLANNPELKTVRALTPVSRGTQNNGAYIEKIYDNVGSWLAAQRVEWFDASLSRADCMLAKNNLSQDKNDVLGEMQALTQRFNAKASAHEGSSGLRALDQLLYARGLEWMSGRSEQRPWLQRQFETLTSSEIKAQTRGEKGYFFSH